VYDTVIDKAGTV